VGAERRRPCFAELARAAFAIATLAIAERADFGRA
jgi:hypothetical protein